MSRIQTPTRQDVSTSGRQHASALKILLDISLTDVYPL